MRFNREGKDTSEIVVEIGVRVICSLCLAGLLYFGFIHPGSGTSTNGIDKGTLWNALHPVHWYNVIGFTCVVLVIVYASGVWELVTGEQYLPAGSTWTNGAAIVCGLLGAALLFA